MKLVSVMWLISLLEAVAARGLLLLYRPRDITGNCVSSRRLRHDLSFGNGLSDTITLVFRTLSEIDYECEVEIVTESRMFLLVVIRFPNTVGVNCAANGDAIVVMKKDLGIRICDEVRNRDQNSTYFIIAAISRIRFQFLSNSSVNTDMGANLYQVTATAARRKPDKGCDIKNESLCAIEDDEFCFTSGVVCDGIKNCGVSDWFDERKSECELPIERIGYAPVMTVMAVLVCLALAAVHLLARVLPPPANSLFIFNANEDNRLRVDPVFRAPDFAPCDIETARRMSVIPVFSSSEDETTIQEPQLFEQTEQEIKPQNESKIPENTDEVNEDVEQSSGRRKTTMRTMTRKLQQHLRKVTSKTAARTD